MSLYPTSSAWKGAKPIFMLEINWNGRIYRPSTEAISISSNDGVIALQGGMTGDPDFQRDIGAVGFNVSSYSTAFALYLENVDVALQHANHNRLENCSAELSYLLASNESTQAYEARQVLLTGIIKEPVFGHKDKSFGYVEFSVETEILESSFHDLSVGSGARISAEDLSDLVNPTLSPLSALLDANNILSVLELHKGKILPIIIGQPGIGFNINYGTVYYPATPAYVIWATHGASNQIWLCLAPHDVAARTVRIYDDLGNFRTEQIEKWIRRDGRVFSFVEFTHGAGTFQNPVDDESARFFVAWTGDGGYISSSTNTPLKGGGDICLWALSQGNQAVDFAAWECLREYLNQYEFGGYITNTEITPLEFLENEIIPFLPISVIQGINGMKPVLDILASGIKPTPIQHVTADAEFSSSSGIQRLGDTSSIVNDYTLEYGWDIKHSEHRDKITITGDTSLITDQIMSNSIAQSSFNQYGARKMIETSTFVIDFNTAALICFDKMRQHALPLDFIDYQIAPRYGYLQVGDIITLTDSDLSLDNVSAQIVSKTWNTSNWQIRLKIILSEIT